MIRGAKKTKQNCSSNSNNIVTPLDEPWRFSYVVAKQNGRDPNLRSFLSDRACCAGARRFRRVLKHSGSPVLNLAAPRQIAAVVASQFAPPPNAWKILSHKAQVDKKVCENVAQKVGREALLVPKGQSFWPEGCERCTLCDRVERGAEGWVALLVSCLQYPMLSGIYIFGGALA